MARRRIETVSLIVAILNQIYDMVDVNDLFASAFSYKRILVLISHSQDFLNGVCTNIVHMTKKRLKYYTGNYETFFRTRMELLENQMKQYNWEQDQISHMKVGSVSCNIVAINPVYCIFSKLTVSVTVVTVSD